DPWDFDDDNEGFYEVAYDGDQNTVGTGPIPWLWTWRNGPGGGGACGWEDQIHAALATFLPAGHPDRIAQPWGIWHTGAIARGPLNGNATLSQGVPFYEGTPSDPQNQTILWDSRPTGPNGVDNRTGQWCASYFS